MIDISDAHIQIALNNPELFYHNILVNVDSNDSLLLNDSIPYTSVYLFLNDQETGKSSLEVYIQRYTMELQEECSKVSKDNVEIKKMANKSHFVRNLIYKKELEILLSCDNCSKYENYISDYGGVCEEFDLYAKYKIACQKRKPFPYYNQVIISYPNSDLFDINDLKQKCHIINGIHVLWSDNANEHQKAIITQIINGLVPSLNGGGYFMKEPVTKKQWCIVCGVLSKNNVDTLFPNVDTSIICTYADCLQFINAFQNITSVAVRLTNLDVIKQSINNKIFIEKQISYEWFLEDETSSYNVAVYKHSPFRIEKTVDYLSYATFRLTI